MIPYFTLGVVFGTVMLESEVVSWFRIQEMFRFQAFHMFGIIGSAVIVAALGVEALKWLRLRDETGAPLQPMPKALGTGVRYLIGGTIFGVGWALTGACPGPLVTLVGGGVPVMLVAIASAVTGTWVYGYLRPRLPH